MTSWTGPAGSPPGRQTHGGGCPPGRSTYHSPLLILLTMKGHAFTAYLRVYQPLAAFPPRERAEWAAYVEAGQVLPASLLVGREERRGLARALGLTVGAEREHALVERVGDVVFLCPLRTELRTLQSLVAFRSSVPDEVADAFVSAGDFERAEQTLERWESERPGTSPFPGSRCSRTASDGSGPRPRARWPGSPTGPTCPRRAAASLGPSASCRS